MPHMLNRLDSAMVPVEVVVSTQPIRRVKLSRGMRAPPPAVQAGVQARLGSMPGAGLMIHLGKIVGHDLAGGRLGLDVEYRRPLEDGDKVCHGTEHVVVPRERMPTVAAIGEVADICLSPSGILTKQSPGLFFLGQTIADGIDSTSDLVLPPAT